MHYFAILVILAVIVKLLKVIPREYEIACSLFYQFISTQLMKALMFLVGIAIIDLNDIIATLSNPVYLILIVATVVLAFIGAASSDSLSGLSSLNLQQQQDFAWPMQAVVEMCVFSQHQKDLSLCHLPQFQAVSAALLS